MSGCVCCIKWGSYKRNSPWCISMVTFIYKCCNHCQLLLTCRMRSDHSWTLLCKPTDFVLFGIGIDRRTGTTWQAYYHRYSPNLPGCSLPPSLWYVASNSGQRYNTFWDRILTLVLLFHFNHRFYIYCIAPMSDIAAKYVKQTPWEMEWVQDLWSS